MDLEQLKYPTGRLSLEPSLGDARRAALIDKIAAAPALVRAAVEGLSGEQLDTAYRPGGWTIRQVVHHLPDSHINSYVRFKLALTEDNPVIKTYDQEAWAATTDSRSGAIGPSLDLLEALHARWTDWLRQLTPEQWQRRFRHPEMGELGLDQNLQVYAWHGHHHLGHITNLKREMNWI
jgi:hypothetical protein